MGTPSRIMNHIIHVSERSERRIRKLCELRDHPPGRAVSSRRAGLVLVSAVVAFLIQSQALAQIAARYPRDKNIASDPPSSSPMTLSRTQTQASLQPNGARLRT